MLETLIALGVALQAVAGSRPSASLTLTDTMLLRSQAFDKHYIAYKIDLMGCPKDWKTSADCKPEFGVINYKEFLAAGREARKLFGLKDGK